MYAMMLRLSLPPEKTIEAISIIKSMAGPVMDDPECISFRFYREVANDDALALWEKWKTLEALKQHIRSKEFLKILTVMDLACHTPEISIQRISDWKGFEFIQKLRKGYDDASF
jgi:quinol monooxygenase YgiN